MAHLIDSHHRNLELVALVVSSLILLWATVDTLSIILG